MHKNINDVFVFSQARLNSQRLPQKMIRNFCGTTLWDLICRKLEQIDLPVTQKWVSVHEDELYDIAQKYKISIYRRSYESANSDLDVARIWEICSHIPFKYYCFFNPCLPFLRLDTMQEFIDNYVHSDYRSMFGVIPMKNYFWNEEGDLFFPKGIKLMESKSCPQTYVAAHAVYGGLTEDIRKGVQLGSFTKDDPALFMMENKIECLDIDDQKDWDIACAVWRYYRDKFFEEGFGY